MQALFTYGDALGISFQMVDDFLDFGGAGDDIGKRIGDDFRERKVTLPIIRAFARADVEERAFWQRTIAKGDQQDGDFEQACAIIARHGTLEETRAEALAWSHRAKRGVVRSARYAIACHAVRPCDLCGAAVELTYSAVRTARA